MRDHFRWIDSRGLIWELWNSQGTILSINSAMTIQQKKSSLIIKASKFTLKSRENNSCTTLLYLSLNSNYENLNKIIGNDFFCLKLINFETSINVLEGCQFNYYNKKEHIEGWYLMILRNSLIMSTTIVSHSRSKSITHALTFETLSRICAAFE